MLSLHPLATTSSNYEFFVLLQLRKARYDGGEALG